MSDFVRSLQGPVNPSNAVNSMQSPGAPSALGTIFVVSHPFLLAIAPIAHLYSRNMNEADPTTAFIFGGGALTMTAVLLVLAWLWQRSLVKAVLIVSLFNVLFYGYGWAFDWLMQHEPFKLSYGQ